MDLLRLDLNKTQPDTARAAEVRFQVALLAAIAAAVVSFMARFLFGAPLIPELLAQYIFSVAPIWADEIAVGLLGTFAKHLAFLACTTLFVLALIGAAIGYLRWLHFHVAENTRRVAPIIFGLCLGASTSVALI